MHMFGKMMDGAVKALFWVAALVVAALLCVVVADVLIRNTVGLSIRWASAVVEYALLVAAMAAAPALVRSNGHIRVEILSKVLPDAARKILERLVSGSVAILCLILAWYAATGGYAVWVRGEIDIRSVALPRWILYAVLSTGFALCAIEFLRHALSPDTASGGDPDQSQHGI